MTDRFIAERLNRIKPSPSPMATQKGRELRAAGRYIIGLTSGESDFDTPDNVTEAVNKAMLQGKTKYTDVGGVPELKLAIQDKFRRNNNLEYSADEIIVGTGAKQVVFNALMCAVEKGDEVIIPTPYYASYPDIVLLAHGTRQVKYLNNVVEQDHRAIKRITRPMEGFKDFDCARVILSGIETTHMIKKGQMKCLGKIPLSAAQQVYSLI